MKAYVMTTGALFGLIVVAHAWRAVEEGTHVAKDPWFVAFTVLSVALCGWAFVLLRRAPRA